MDIWTPDPDPQVAAIEGRWTDNLAHFLYHVHQGAHLALGLPSVPRDDVQAAYHSLALPVAKADGVNRAQRLFEALLQQPKAARKAEDLADALTQDWFERGLLGSEAARAITQGQLRGRIEAAGKPQAALDSYEPEAAVLYGQARAAVHVTRLRDTTRAVLAGAVLDALMRGDSPQKLALDLTQRFGVLNRDARRLAITEIAFARANGFLAGIPVGDEVEWFTAAGCCQPCARLNGKRFKVVRGAGDPLTEVWVGKHNAGLPAALRTPAIPFHPNCRCRWLRVVRPAAEVSARTFAALAALDE